MRSAIQTAGSSRAAFCSWRITIKDRLRVPLPNHPESYYRHREIVPPDMLADIDRAKIVITNYHAFKLRERISVSKGTRTALEGWRGETLETEGQMLQRVMPELMGMKHIVVLNDEAHHCYRERMKDAEGETEADLKGEDKTEAKANNEAARMWISGNEAVKRKLGIALVYDLSATPFFLRGSDMPAAGGGQERPVPLCLTHGESAFVASQCPLSLVRAGHP